MAINTQALRGAVYAKFHAASALSAQLGWQKNKIGNTLKGKYTPNIDECAELAKALNLSPQQFYCIFLPDFSPNGDNAA